MEALCLTKRHLRKGPVRPVRGQQARTSLQYGTRCAYLVRAPAVQQQPLVPRLPNKLRRLYRSTPSLTQHTADESHRSNIQQSLGDRYIQELTAAYKEPLSTKSPKPSFVARPTLSTRSSTRIREAYQRRKDKEHLVADVSTMTSQKNHKLEDFEQRVKCKTKRIRKA